jgi:hypothetical protein
MNKELELYESKKRFSENIKLLVKSEYEEIFRIIKKYKEAYTENSNGIFFDINSLSKEAFTEMNGYMNFCMSNRADDENRMKEMQEIRSEQHTLLHEDS